MRGKRKPGGPKKTWKMQVEKESKSVGLEKKDAMNQARRRMGVGEIAAGINLDQNWLDDDDVGHVVKISKVHFCLLMTQIVFL